MMKLLCSYLTPEECSEFQGTHGVMLERHEYQTDDGRLVAVWKYYANPCWYFWSWSVSDPASAYTYMLKEGGKRVQKTAIPIRALCPDFPLTMDEAMATLREYLNSGV